MGINTLGSQRTYRVYPNLNPIDNITNVQSCWLDQPSCCFQGDEPGDSYSMSSTLLMKHETVVFVT